MLPKLNCNTGNCLPSLVGVRSQCQTETKCPPVFIEQLDGIDLKKLSLTASRQAVSGVTNANDLIESAAVVMRGDLEFLINNGFSLRQSFGELASQGQFASSYQQGGGVTIKNVSNSTYSQLRVNYLEILANYTGAAVLVFDDKSGTNTTYDVELIAGQIMPVKLDYITSQKSVNIYLADSTIPLAQIDYVKKSGCGCGGAQNANAVSKLVFSGLLNNISSPTQYGFKVTASVTCNTDALICELVSQMPNAFALTLLYKIGEKYHLQNQLSNRINQETLQDDQTKKDFAAYYNKLYKERMNGTAITKGLNKIISDYLRRKRTDSCIICDGVIKTAWAIT